MTVRVKAVPSTISSVAAPLVEFRYDDVTKTLYAVEGISTNFPNGRVTAYKNVPPTVGYDMVVGHDDPVRGFLSSVLGKF